VALVFLLALGCARLEPGFEADLDRTLACYGCGEIRSCTDDGTVCVELRYTSSYDDGTRNVDLAGAFRAWLGHDVWDLFDDYEDDVDVTATYHGTAGMAVVTETYTDEDTDDDRHEVDVAAAFTGAVLTDDDGSRPDVPLSDFTLNANASDDDSY
jgi:hypothetical protein